MSRYAIPTWILYGLLCLPVHAGELTVHTQTVQQANYSRPIETSGTLANATEQTLAFKTPGIVAKVAVRDGERVKAGQVLARLDRAEFEAEAQQASALLQEAKRAQQRLQKLYANKVVPLDQVQSADTSVEVALARLRVAEFNLKHTTIVAPSSGTILRKLIEPNEIVNAQRSAFIFASSGQGWIIRVGLNDRDIIRVQEGDTAEIRFDAYPNAVVTGSIHEIAAKASPGTGTFEVEIRLDKNELRLLSGMVARAILQPRDETALIRIPLTAIVAASGSSAEVYILGDNERVQSRHIQIADMDPAAVTVLEGLEVGETLITRGATALSDGQAVKALPLVGQN